MALSIGDVARETGFPPTTLRCYESIGLVPPPDRVSGRRAYKPAVVDRLRVVALARSLDFLLDDIRELFDGFPTGTPASERWRAANVTQIEALEAQAADIERMLGLLRHLSEDCECADLAQCATAWIERDPDHG
jgi:MerR family transcriptional regulator, redox-sensitive transcriptional activator SoxR